VFQRILRDWDRVHPYNAAQILELRRNVDPQTATTAWSQTLEESRLGRIEIARGTYRHICLNGELAKYPVRLLPAETSLEVLLSAELNQAFDPKDPPFRAFLIPSGDGQTSRFGVVYQHWIADSVAVRNLLQRWVQRAFSAESLPPFQLKHAGEGYVRLAGRATGDLTPGQTLLSLLRRHLRFRYVQKVKTLGEADYPVAVIMSRGDGIVPKLVESARRRGVKVNDLLLAATARACDGRVPTQRRGKRQDLAVGSIVDLRPFVRGSLDQQFGLFLGFTENICRPAELKNTDLLVRTIAKQNRLHRHRGIWSTSTGWLMAARATRPLVPDKNIYRFLRKETPIVAGLSNVNLNKTWVAEENDLIAGYIRVSPTGPLAPVAMAITSLGNDVQLSLTYRKALLTEHQAKDLAEAFFAELARL
jgi:hypothetical protein